MIIEKNKPIGSLPIVLPGKTLLFVDSADGNYKMKRSNGDIITIGSGGSGGSGGASEKNKIVAGGGAIPASSSMPIFYDDFVGVEQPQWTVRTATGSSIVDSVVANGFITDKTGPLTNDEQSYDFNDVCNFVVNKNPIFEVGFLLGHLNDIRIEMGLINLTETSYIKFMYDSSIDGNWHMRAHDGVSGIGTVVTLAINGNPMILKFEGETSSGLFKIYVDNRLATTLDVSALILDTYYQPFRRITNLNGASGAKDCSFDYFKIWQNR